MARAVRGDVGSEHGVGVDVVRSGHRAYFFNGSDERAAVVDVLVGLGSRGGVVLVGVVGGGGAYSVGDAVPLVVVGIRARARSIGRREHLVLVVPGVARRSVAQSVAVLVVGIRSASHLGRSMRVGVAGAGGTAIGIRHSVLVPEVAERVVFEGLAVGGTGGDPACGGVGQAVEVVVVVGDGLCRVGHGGICQGRYVPRRIVGVGDVLELEPGAVGRGLLRQAVEVGRVIRVVGHHSVAELLAGELAERRVAHACGDHGPAAGDFPAVYLNGLADGADILVAYQRVVRVGHLHGLPLAVVCVEGGICRAGDDLLLVHGLAEEVIEVLGRARRSDDLAEAADAVGAGVVCVCRVCAGRARG